MGKSPCCPKEGLNRGAWSALEDKLLTSYIEAHGEGKWTHVPKKAGLNRCGKSCRLRWLNYLRPNIKRGNITLEEEELIIRLHNLLGNRWSLIAGRLPGRTDNEIKNYWNTTLAKKLRTESSAMPEAVSEVDQPQVIQTKASRCKNVVILEPSFPNYQSSNIMSRASKHMEFHGHESHLTTHFTNQSTKAQVVDEICGNNEFQLNSGADFFKDFAFNYESSMDADDGDHFGAIEEVMVNEWSETSGFEMDDNASMDFDSLALLLESGDWP